MNKRWLRSSFDSFPCWQKNHLSQKLRQINGNTPPIYIKPKYFERIISVQEQRGTRAVNSLGIQCKSNYTDKCYAEYNINSLRRGFGLLKDIQYESVEPGRPSLVIHSSAVEKNENDIAILTNLVIEELARTELRKRFAIVHTERFIYVIGGYIFDPSVPTRKVAAHDYKYDTQTHQFTPIQALPNRAIGFGLCVDDDRIYAIGGNNINNVPLSDCYGLTIRTADEKWIKLPNLPAPTSGPGVGIFDGELHCIGGYDILGTESVTHSEYLILRYPKDKQWQHAPKIDVNRARPLVFIVPDNSKSGRSIYAAGGFNIDSNTQKPYIVPDLQLFNQLTQRWQRLITIPDLELTHALSFGDNQLHVSETIELPNRLPQATTLRSFDLRTLNWIDGKNDSDSEGVDQQSSASLNSPVNLPSDLKANRANQLDRLDSSEESKVLRLKIPDRKLQVDKVKSGIPTTRELNQTLPVRNELPMKSKPGNKLVSLSTSPSPSSTKKMLPAKQQLDRNLKMKR